MNVNILDRDLVSGVNKILPQPEGHGYTVHVFVLDLGKDLESVWGYTLLITLTSHFSRNQNLGLSRVNFRPEVVNDEIIKLPHNPSESKE